MAGESPPQRSARNWDKNRRRLDPGEPIRTAVIGAGHWGPNLIRNFDSPPASVVKVVVDRDGARLKQVKARFPGVAVAEDAAVALADPTIDAVVIATPTSSHYALVKAALEAGKHVLVEKPITTHGGEAEELVTLAERRGRVLMVGHVFIFNLAVQRVRAYLTAGDLGASTTSRWCAPTSGPSAST